MTLDMDGFDRDMAAQREKSRTVTSFSTIGQAYKDLSAAGFKSEFKGYDALKIETRVKLLVAGAEAVESAGAGTEVEVVTDQTCFYGESGGQAGDRGKLTADGLVMTIADTAKDPTGLIIHKGTVESGIIETGQRVTLAVDMAARQATAANHTATHILHAVLREVLGDHVKQAGSLVTPERLRFDFTHFSQVSPQELERIEALVNDRIRENVSTEVQEMAADEAFQSGATALFEEKYGDRVRVVSLADFSKELCGGTHTGRTGDIGLFKIVSEASVASGVRRMEALTGSAALDQAQEEARILHQSARLLKDQPQALAQRIEKLMADLKASEKEKEKLKAQMAAASAGEADAEAEDGQRGQGPGPKSGGGQPGGPPGPGRPVPGQDRFGRGGAGRGCGRQGPSHRHGDPRPDRELPCRQDHQSGGRPGGRRRRRTAGHGPGRRQPAGKARRGPGQGARHSG